jgi:nucleotide-binding universal stress UspA family protein
MAVFSSVLCAVDGSSLAPRVLRHAIGVAGACGAQLTLLTVSSGDARTAEATVAATLRDVLPAGATYVGTPRIRAARVSIGQPVDAILELAREGIDLIVAGTHSKSGLSRWLLGSTSAGLLEQARCPTLLVPPGQLDIVTLAVDAVRFHPGTVLTAVDLAEDNPRQLQLARQLAALAEAPLLVMTVAGPEMADDVAETALRARTSADGGPGGRVLVRRGAVAEAIDHAAVSEHAGLVVMGLRPRGHGVAGEIATAVLRTKDAAVLAVPVTAC